MGDDENYAPSANHLLVEFRHILLANKITKKKWHKMKNENVSVFIFTRDCVVSYILDSQDEKI